MFARIGVSCVVLGGNESISKLMCELVGFSFLKAVGQGCPRFLAP